MVKRAYRLSKPPNMSVKQQTTLQKIKRSRCCVGGGVMVESEPVARGIRWPKSNWEIPAKEKQKLKREKKNNK